ncbi:MAG: hypothetical protein J6W84_01830 [Bacteroidales bacterium]|nr:hypothetical protein [Bacteroidales bacterium]MBQ7489181.1 hypothetical protein [Bacteroidales bacterium]
MKKIFLLPVLLMTITLGFAQKDFGGTIKMKTYATGTEDANILSQVQGEAEMTVWGSKTKVVNSQQGIGSVIIVDGNTGITNIVIDLSLMAYGKYLISDTADYSTVKFDYEYDANDTKEIAGYHCKKVVVTATDLETDESNNVTLYVTDDLMNAATYKSPSYPGLKGFPLYTARYIENDGNPFTMVNEAVELKPDKKINAKSFILPAGWEPIENAPDEVKQMLGMGAGGEDEEEDEY